MNIPIGVPGNTLPGGTVFSTDLITFYMVVSSTEYTNLANGALSSFGTPVPIVFPFPNASFALN